MIESLITFLTRNNSDGNRTILKFPLHTGLKVRHLYREKPSLRLFQTYFHLRKGNCKLDSDCQRIYINSVVSITNFSKEFFLMRLSASGALYFTQNNINRNNKYMQQQKKLTHGNLTNISVPLFPNCNIANTTTKHAPFAITRQLVHEGRVVFSTWLPLSPFPNSQRSSTHPGPIRGPFG